MKCLCLLLLVACGSSTPAPKTQEAPHEEIRRETPTPVVQQELGSIDERGVEETFQNLQGPLEKCHTQGRDRIEVLAGDAKVFLRVDAGGKVRYSYFQESSLGDRDTEKCLLDLFAKTPWPKPIGGEAEVRHAFGWESGQERSPSAWAAEKVTAAMQTNKAVQAELATCKAGLNGDFTLTAYVEHDDSEPAPNVTSVVLPAKKKNAPIRAPKPVKLTAPALPTAHGKFRSIGFASSNREAGEKADCIVSALKKLTLPDPGSYLAKVSFRL